MRQASLIGAPSPAPTGAPSGCSSGASVTSFSYTRHNPGPAAPLARALAAGRWRSTSANDMTVRHTLVSSALVDTVHRAGGRVFAWTVNTREGIDRMRDLGADGVITDDPRLFRRQSV